MLLMVSCDSCNKELDRRVFCSSNCKVGYHRKNIEKSQSDVKDITEKKVKKKPISNYTKKGVLCPHKTGWEFCEKCK